MKASGIVTLTIEVVVCCVLINDRRSDLFVLEVLQPAMIEIAHVFDHRPRHFTVSFGTADGKLLAELRVEDVSPTFLTTAQAPTKANLIRSGKQDSNHHASLDVVLVSDELHCLSDMSHVFLH